MKYSKKTCYTLSKYCNDPNVVYCPNIVNDPNVLNDHTIANNLLQVQYIKDISWQS
jgi:hypothetical protein